ncbi:MAG: PocR ligand-binding domain-containing protein [Desulfobacterales bacterium]
MLLTDLQPAENWGKLEEEIRQRSGMRARVYDIDGIGISGKSAPTGELCSEIRATGKGQTYICAVAHQNMAAMAQNTKNFIIEECDAGLIKIVVPIFVDGEFLGAAGGCGRLLEDGEVDDFMINKTTDIPDDRIAELAETIQIMTRSEAEDLAEFIRGRIERIVQDYRSRIG